MIEIKDKKDCCGCGACANICPRECISMEADEEGFLYPRADKDICIECGLCEKVCPVLHAAEDIPFAQDAYIVQILDERIRRESTAGGSFTAIARYVAERGGVVFGAAYGEGFTVHHTCAERMEELGKFRNSKYVQSDTEATFRRARAFLKEGRTVCYSGTPCQIEGLKRFLGKEYPNLITVDVVCHAVPSPLVWKKYVEVQEGKFGDQIGNILFRDKHYGYKYSTMTVKDNKGQDLYARGIDTDPMLRAFFSNICDRPSCYACAFKKRYRLSDFTIWDCYPVYRFSRKMDDDKGTTRLLVHSDKGREIFLKIRDQMKTSRVDPDRLTENVREMFSSVPENGRREEFFKDAGLLGGEELFGKYFPETWKVKANRALRMALLRTGVYSRAKRLAADLLKK